MKITVSQLVVVMMSFFCLIIAPQTSVAVDDPKSQAGDETSPGMPRLLPLFNLLLSPSETTGINLVGVGEDTYEIYDATSHNLITKAHTNEIVELSGGKYMVVLHGISMIVTIPSRQLLTILTGGVTVSGTGVGSVEVYDETSTDHLVDVSQGHPVELLPDKYTLRVNGVFVAVTVLAPFHIEVMDGGKINIPDPTSGPPVSGGHADVIVVECDGSLNPSEEHILDCMENKLKDIEEMARPIIRAALINGLRDIALTTVGSISNLATVLTTGYSLYLAASSPVPEEWKRVMEAYLYILDGCGLPFGHAVICN